MAIQTYTAKPKQEYIPQNFNSDILVNAVNETAKGIQSAIRVNNDIDEIKSNSLLSDLQTQQAILSSEFQKANELDPDNQDNFKQFQLNYDKLTNDFLAKVPQSARQSFLTKQAQFKSQNKSEMEVWKFNARIKNVERDVAGNILNLNQKAQEFGRRGDFETALLDYNKQSNLILDSSSIALGADKTSQIRQSLPSDFATNYITGMLFNNPSGALSALQDKRIQSMIGDVDTLTKLQDVAMKRQDNIATYRTQKDVAMLSKTEKDMVEKAYNQDLDFITLNNFLEANGDKITTHTKNYLMRVAGFDLDKITGKRKAEDIPIKEKYQAIADIEDNIAAIAINPENITSDKVKSIQEKIFKYADSSILTDTEAKKYLGDLGIYNDKILKYETEQDYSRDGWFSDKGALKIKGFINDLNKTGGLKDTSDRYFQAQGFMYNTYRRNIDDVASKYAISKGIDIRQFSSPKEYLNTLDENSRDEILTTSYLKTKKDYAKNILGLDVENKTTQEIDNSINIKVEQDRYVDVYNSIDDKTDALTYFNNYMIYGK